MSKHLKLLLAFAALALMVAAPAMAAKFTFHGDLNNRFLVYTDQINFFSSDASNASLEDQDAPDSFVSTKYRLWVEAATDDGKVKGVYAIELGALRFGAGGSVGKSVGGSFSGDGVNIETRWAYTDFELPGTDFRFRVGLQTHAVNPLFWAESAMGVKFYTDNWYLAWMRPKDTQSVAGDSWGDGDLDAFTARYDMKMEPVKVGFFLNYFTQDVNSASKPVALTGFMDADQVYAVDSLPSSNFNMFAIGIDGDWSAGTSFGKVFAAWDLIYENGSLDDMTTDGGVTTRNLDLSGYMLHGDLGVSFGAATVTYSVYYASGDDNPNDNDLDAYMEVDTDANYSIILNEGGYTDDDYFSDHYAPFGDKGIFVNKLALDFQASKKTKVGASVLYILTAEDVTLVGGKTDDSVGLEFDAYVSHKLYDNLEVALNFGFLAADDVMDRYEEVAKEDGNSDIDVWRS
ncbi:MAG: hypothetical protein WBX50_04140, partial [Candidatus Deferrimicrobiaceae bacterium]